MEVQVPLHGDGAELPDLISAVVSRGGRPDLAGARLTMVRAPTLLIVGGRDEVVLELNREALDQLKAEAELAVIPGATHLFEEPGALEEVATIPLGQFTIRTAYRRDLSGMLASSIPLPWNLKREIMSQMNHVGAWGCRFIIPIPTVEVLQPHEIVL